jgi:recombination protein RecT
MATTNIKDLKETNQQRQQVARQPAKTFPQMLEAHKEEIAKALPKHLTADRMARIALTAFRQTPALGNCDPRSVFASVIQSSQLGLEVGLMGEAYLVPFKNRKKVNGSWTSVHECTLIPGYRGLMKLARNTGLISDIYAWAVREKDKFEVRLGLDQTLIHEPKLANGFPADEDERGDIVGFYAVAVFKDGTRHFEIMSRKQVEAIRDRSSGYRAAKMKAAEKKKDIDSAWESDFEPMGLKTVLRRLCKYLPASPELALALTLDDRAAQGKPAIIDLNEAIEGTWVPDDAGDDDAGDDGAAVEGEYQPAKAQQQTATTTETPATEQDDADFQME